MHSENLRIKAESFLDFVFPALLLTTFYCNNLHKEYVLRKIYNKKNILFYYKLI